MKLIDKTEVIRMKEKEPIKYPETEEKIVTPGSREEEYTTKTKEKEE